MLHEEHLLVLLLATGWIISLVFKDWFHPSARLFFAALLINQSVIRHALSRLATPAPIVFGFSSLHNDPSVSSEVAPFVSIVLIGQSNSSTADIYETLSCLQAFSSPLLAAEIVVPFGYTQSRVLNITTTHSVSPLTKYIVFVSIPTIVSPGWMNGIVRELMSDDLRIVVPVLRFTENRRLTAAMISSVQGNLVPLMHTESSREVPIIPQFSVIGVSRKLFLQFPNLTYLIETERVVELSLRAWFCFHGIAYTRFTSVEVRNPSSSNWIALEGDDVDERIKRCERNIDWFYDKFSEFDPDAIVDLFRIRNFNSCLSLDTEKGPLSLSPCSFDQITQRFVLYNENRAIRSVRFPNVCFDAGITPNTSSPVLLLQCMPGKRSQEFKFITRRLMAGSFCVQAAANKSVNLEQCQGYAESMINSQVWEALPMK